MKWPVPAVRIWLGLLGASAALLGQITPARAEPARLSVEDLIRGMTQLTENWMSQKSWMVHYKHSRQPARGPANLGNFPEIEIYNARKGSRLYVHDKQELMRSDGTSTGRMYECWASWDGKIYVERQSTSVIILPEPSTRPYQMLFYTGLLDLDLVSDIRIRPAGLQKNFGGEASPNEFWEALPRSVLEHQPEFKVRPQLEVVDGTPCHVLERPEKDVIWIDTTHGFLMRRRIYYWSPESPLFERSNRDVHEKAPGIWLPAEEGATFYNPNQAPAESRGKPEITISAHLIEARFNDLPDSFFEVPIPERALVIDRVAHKADRGRRPVKIALYVGIMLAAFFLVYQSWRLIRKPQSPGAMAGA